MLHGPDESGATHPYYMNVSTGETQWESPYGAQLPEGHAGHEEMYTAEGVAASSMQGGDVSAFLRAGYTEEQAQYAAASIAGGASGWSGHEADA